MNTKALVLALAAVCAGSATPAFAQHDDRGHRYEQRHDRDYRQEYREDYRDAQRERREMQREVRREVRQEVRRETRDERRYDNYYRGAGPRHDLYRGARLPSAYHGDRYVVRDYQRYKLSAPPRGSHWVRAGNDYLLVALATGIIANVLLN